MTLVMTNIYRIRHVDSYHWDNKLSQKAQSCTCWDYISICTCCWAWRQSYGHKQVAYGPSFCITLYMLHAVTTASNNKINSLPDISCRTL